MAQDILNIMAEVSIYPLRTSSLSGPINAFVDILRSEPELEVRIGNMSTQVLGESKLVFSTIEKAFAKAAAISECVMTLKISNACPYTPPEQT